MPSVRKCKTCGESKPATADFFSPSRECLGGITWTCRPCKAAYHRGWKSRNRESVRASSREYYKLRNGLFTRRELKECRVGILTKQARRLRHSIVTRSKEKGWASPVWATSDFIEAWLIKQPFCECCGRSFSFSKCASNAAPRGDGPSIDRFDSSRDYALDNVSLICWRCNNIKRDYEAEDLIAVARWMRARTQKFEVLA